MGIYKILQEIIHEQQISISAAAKRCDLHNSTIRTIILKSKKRHFRSSVQAVKRASLYRWKN